MLNTFPIMLFVGTALGFLSGLGIGGGSLLILWLTIFLNVDPFTAKAINLLFFVPSAVIACLFRFKQKKLPLRKLFPAIVAGCVGAAIFAWLAGKFHAEVLKKIFGIILLITGARELFFSGKSKPS